MQMVGGNGGYQFRQYAAQNAGNLNGYNAVQNVGNQVAQNPRVQNVRNQNGPIGVQGNGIRIRLGMQASSSGTQTDKAPVYDSDGSAEVIQICLWCVDSGCSNHMTGNQKLLINFVWKFMGTVRFRNDHVAAILGFGKRKRASHPPKLVPNSRQRLHLLHMDLCGPIRIASIKGKRYILVIVDDYSRYTWVHFLRSKDEAPEVIITFLKRITVLLQSLVIIIRTDNGTEFKNQVLKVYFDSVGITHQMSSARTPQQNGVVERRNRTLVEAARTIKPDISFLHVFGALCYPKNDREDIGKLGAK
nr:hypothetical protein [Tanacetum cinerariifolium]